MADQPYRHTTNGCDALLGGHDEVFGGWAGHASPRIRYQRGIGANRQDRHHAAVLGGQRRPRRCPDQGLRPLYEAPRQGSRTLQARHRQARRGAAVRRQCQDGRNRADHGRESEADRRCRVLAISDRDCPGDDAGQGAVDYFQRWHSLDHHPVALHRALLVQHVASGLSDGHVCGQDAWLQDRGHGLHGFSARQGLDRRVQDRLRASRRQDHRTRSPWATRRRCRTSRRSSSA